VKGTEQLFNDLYKGGKTVAADIGNLLNVKPITNSTDQIIGFSNPEKINNWEVYSVEQSVTKDITVTNYQSEATISGGATYIAKYGIDLSELKTNAEAITISWKTNTSNSTGKNIITFSYPKPKLLAIEMKKGTYWCSEENGWLNKVNNEMHQSLVNEINNSAHDSAASNKEALMITELTIQEKMKEITDQQNRTNSVIIKTKEREFPGN
jgi:hypothetical protein